MTLMRCAFVLSVVLTMFAAAASADYLVLADERVLEGEALEQREDGSIVFRFRVGDVWTTATFGRRDYKQLFEEPGDQSDRGKPEGDAKPERTKPRDRRPSREAERPAPGPPDVPEPPFAAVIPLKGPVGPIGELNRPWFSAAQFRTVADRAIQDGATVLVLEIDSPGGSVTEMEAICDLLMAYQQKVQVVAWTREAYSAAAIISFTCRTIVVHPTGSIGAAVMIDGEMNAVDAKMASPHLAKQRRYAAFGRHPIPVLEAMTQQKKSLWRRGALFESEQPDGDEGDAWTQVDDEETVLTLTAEEALEWGIASSSARSARSVVESLLLLDEHPVVSYAGYMDSLREASTDAVSEISESFVSYFLSISAVADGLNDAVAAAEAGDQRRYNAACRDIARQVRVARTAHRTVSRIDRRELSDEFDVPDTVIERLRADLRILQSLLRKLNEQTVEGLNGAIDDFNSMIDEWRRLLGR